jgi:uncharacterized delta-60 repeat protein
LFCTIIYIDYSITKKEETVFNLKSHLYSFKNSAWNTLLLVMALSLLTFTIALAATGDLDTTFSGDGKVTTNIGGVLVNETAFGVAIQPDGKIVAVGDHFNTKEAGGKGDFAVVRYKTNGALDSLFSGDGKLTSDFGDFDQAFDVAIQSDGKIVVVGQTCNPPNFDNCDLALSRYNSNGSLDTTFSGDGKVNTDFGAGDNGSFGGIAIQSGGKIVVAGYMHNGSNYDFAVYRFNANGILDTTFSVDGMVNTGFGSGRIDFAYDLAIQSGGKIVLSGYTCDSSEENCNFAVARFNANGTLDTTFSADGKVTTEFGGEDYGLGVVVQSNGKIVVAGRNWISSDDSRLALVRYNTNGSLDTTFSGDGKVLTNPTPGVPDSMRGLAIQTDGKIVVVGEKGNDGSRDFILARYNSNGSLDNTFSGNGWLTTDFGGDDYASDIAIQANGRLVVAGRTNAGAGADWDFALARYMP